jgi:cytochrome c oxidase cbb3-type subunit 3
LRFSNHVVHGMFAVVAVAQLAAQTSTSPAGNAPVQTPGGAAGAAGARPRERPSAYPTREVDKAKADRGRVLFGVTCSFCHGSDARGGEGGPNLIRAELVLADKDGETIAPVIQNGRVDRGMPKFDLTMAQVSDVAAFLHSFKVGGYDISRHKPPSVLVGDAASGKTTFQTMCGSCHSVSGDLKGFGSRIDDPRTLQQTWIMPAGGGRGPGQQELPSHVKPTTVTVTPASGEKVEGMLKRIDDFTVTLTDSEGYERTFNRNGDEPKVVIHDPLEPHRQLLAKYTDKEIHDITAYLVTIK